MRGAWRELSVESCPHWDSLGASSDQESSHLSNTYYEPGTL